MDITTNVVRFKPTNCEVYLIQRYVIKFVGDLRQVGCFPLVSSTNKNVSHYIAELIVLDRKTLEKIYLTYIRPIMEYSEVVWDNKTLFLINKSENVQIEAVRIVTG